MMKNGRNEIRNAVILFALFQLVNYISIQIGEEMQGLHLFLGMLAGLAFTELLLGLLSDAAYQKIRRFKKNVKRLLFTKQNV